MEMLQKRLQPSDLRKKVLSMIIPITGESVLQLFASFVSMAMIGRIDAVAVSALGISIRVTQIIWALFKGITTGASVFVAQAYGAKDMERVKKVAHQTLLSTFITIIAVQQLVFWFDRSILSIFNPGESVMGSASLYLKAISWGLPAVVIMLVTSGILQGMGNAKTPMIIAIIVNGINLLLSFMLIFGFGIIPAMGIKGAAMATAIAQTAGAALGLFVLFRKDGVLGSFTKSSFFRVDIRQITSIFKIGIPTSLESIFWQIAAVILTRIILSFGEISFAAYQLGLQAEAISYMPATGFGIAATTFIGQAIGANDKDKAKKYLREIIKGTLAVTLLSTVVLIFFPRYIMAILTDDFDVIRLGSIYLMLMGLVQIPQNLAFVINGALRGAGFTKAPMIAAGVGLWGIRVPLSLILTCYFNFTVVVVWIVICIDLVVRFILSYTMYKMKKIYIGF